MSNKIKFYTKKTLFKEDINGFKVYLDYSWDLINGKHWICMVWNNRTFDFGHGIHKSNKFTAYNLAISDYYERRISNKV